MKCQYHPEQEAMGVCVACGKAICREDLEVIQGRYFCLPCYKQRVSPLERKKSPFWAGFLNLLPGLGYAYLGQWGIAFFAFSLFLFFNFLDDLHAPGDWLIVGLILFCSVEAYQRALRMNALQEKTAPFSFYKATGVVLIAWGSLAFLSEVTTLSMKFLNQLWPILFIALGLWLLFSPLYPKKGGEHEG